MAAAELRLVWRMGMTSLLVVTYPLIVMMLLGPAFSSSLQKTGNYPILVYQKDSESAQTAQALSQFPGFRAIWVDSEEELKAKIRSGEVPIGVVLSSSGHENRADFYIDPQKAMMTDQMIITLEGALAESKGKSAISSISEVNERIDRASGLIRSGASEFSMYKGELQRSKADINSLRPQISQLQDSQLTQKVNDNMNSLSNSTLIAGDMRNAVSLISNKVYDIDTTISQIDSSIVKLTNSQSEVSNFHYKRQSYLNKIDSTDAKLANYQSRLNTASFYANQLASSSDPNARSIGISLQSEISYMQSDVSGARNDLASARYDLQSINTQQYLSDISQSISELSLYKSKLNSVRNDITSSTGDWNYKITSFENELSNARNRLYQMQSTALYADSFFADADQALSSFSTRLDSWGRGMDDSEKNINSVLADLGAIPGYTRGGALLPVKVSKNEVIKNPNLLNVFFPLIVGIDMLLASLLLPMVTGVALKSQGMDRRIRDSKLGAFNFIIGRFIGNYIISMVQVTILALTGLILFGIGNIQSPAAALLVFIFVPAVFTALGMLLSLFVQKESSAIMLSLLISIPSIFLAGVIVPLELLPFPFDLFGRTLPLHWLGDAISKTMVVGLGISSILLNLLYFILFISGCLFLSVIIRKLQE
jgi:ABC-2 type transport system permease protein